MTIINNRDNQNNLMIISLEKVYVSHIDGGYELDDIWNAENYYYSDGLLKNSMYISFLNNLKDKVKASDEDIRKTDYYQSSLHTLLTEGICRQNKTEAELLVQCRYFLNLYHAFKDGTYAVNYEKFVVSSAQSNHPCPLVHKLANCDYYMVSDGHHRLACLYVLGEKLAKVKVIGLIEKGK